jgi:hypothetical protein
MTAVALPVILMDLARTALVNGWAAHIDPTGGEVTLHLRRGNVTVTLCWRLGRPVRLAYATVTTGNGPAVDIDAGGLTALLHGKAPRVVAP